MNMVTLMLEHYFYCFGDLIPISNCRHARSFATMTGSTYEGEYEGLVGDHFGEAAEYGAAPGDVGENLGDVGEYAALPVGLVGEYCGLAGLYAGEVGEAGERLSLFAPNCGLVGL